MISSKKINEIKKIRDLQDKSSGPDADDYMIGLYNGLELALAMLEGREPVYKTCLREPELIDLEDEEEIGRTLYSGVIKRNGG